MYFVSSVKVTRGALGCWWWRPSSSLASMSFFPVGFGLVFSCVFPVLSFLKARNLGAGSFRGPPFGSPLPVPHAIIAHGCCYSPLSFGGGGGREREENSKKSTLLTCTAVTLCLLRYNSLTFIDNSSVYSCNSSFISFIYGDLDGWAGPLLAWAILYLLRRAVLKHILSPPLLRLQELDRPAGVLTSAIPTV